jgi:hypothetical protein
MGHAHEDALNTTSVPQRHYYWSLKGEINAKGFGTHPGWVVSFSRTIPFSWGEYHFILYSLIILTLLIPCRLVDYRIASWFVLVMRYNMSCGWDFFIHILDCNWKFGRLVDCFHSCSYALKHGLQLIFHNITQLRIILCELLSVSTFVVLERD